MVTWAGAVFLVPYATLVDTATVASHLFEATFALVDCRFMLSDPDWGERDYLDAHIPGAVYAHLDRDLSGMKTGSNGRHPLPDVDALTATFGRLGIDDDVQVVAYDQDTGVFASRLWWLLQWTGHRSAAVLDGGFAKWRRERRPIVSGAEIRPARDFRPRLREGAVVGVQDVAAIVGHRGPRQTGQRWKLLDARAPERFRGDVETIDRAAGHIPGAANHFFQWNLDEEGTFLPTDVLRTRLKEAIGDAPIEQVVSYCGSGVTACHNLLALEHAGLAGAKLYPGSWSEWSADPERPIAKGNA